LRKRFQCVFEGISKGGNQTLLNQIYTELYITEGGTGEVNEEHEVRQIETTSRKQDYLEIIRQEELFKAHRGKAQPVRTVLTKGVAGIGKTVLTQKFTLDWAEDQAHQDIHFAFPFTFRELNVLKKNRFSLVGLIHHFFPEINEICDFEQFKVLFIFDGLDECRLPLDFHSKEVLTDVTESTSVDVLLTNLIRGKLLPFAQIWITTRPSAASLIPPHYVDVVTEVRGFSDSKKEEYFRKRFKDKKQANRIIAHIKSSRSIHIMCHIPIFCWINATVLEDMLKTRDDGELPKTLTEMYIHFLVVQTKVKKVKYDKGMETDSHWSPESRKMIESLGKLAFDQLQKGNLIFYESDLAECGIDVSEASVYSGVFTEIFKEERGLYQNKVFCFIHLSVQEFLSALYVHLTFINFGVNLLMGTPNTSETGEPDSAAFKLHQHAVDEALQSPNGHLDLFLRFLLGLSQPANQTFLQGLQTKMQSCPQSNQQTIQYIKKKICDNVSVEKNINLFHCLNELNDCSLVEEIQQYLRSGSLSTDKMSPAQWSALVFILLSSDKDLAVFDLKKYSASEDTLLKLFLFFVFVLFRLSGCNLSGRSCEALASVLSLKSSCLRELDLSNNKLEDAGVKLLSVGLESPNCKLESLSLTGCLITEEGCAALAKALSSNPSHLKELDLSYNHPGDSGVKLLSSRVEDPHCKLEMLRYKKCQHTFLLACPLDMQQEEDLVADGVWKLQKRLKSLEKGVPKVRKQLKVARKNKFMSNYKTENQEKTDNYFKIKLFNPGLPSTGLQQKHAKPQLFCVPLDFCEIELDPNTVSRKLVLSANNKKVKIVDEEQPYPDHPERFEWNQLLCKNGLTGRCYWEVEWSGRVLVSVSYKRLTRRGLSSDCWFGGNELSWGLRCCDDVGYAVCHNNIMTVVPLPASCLSHRIAVYLDFPAGTLSYYRISSDTLTHLHTFNATFTEPLYPGFGFWFDSSACICSL
uniref:B30.2/SPRY domain-containing protein n=1 Tax=Fundulus heteroclitus TaxID=8078 RepID=A0A3Q2PJL5_FUNHE